MLEALILSLMLAVAGLALFFAVLSFDCDDHEAEPSEVDIDADESAVCPAPDRPDRPDRRLCGLSVGGIGDHAAARGAR